MKYYTGSSVATDPDSSYISKAMQDIGYTAFDQPDSIIQGSKKLKYTYGLSLNRVKSVYSESNVVKETRYYLGDYEIQKIGDTTRELHYVNASTGLVAMVIKENSTYNYYYTATDHLGSITTVMDDEGDIVAEQSFDAWGRRRNTTNWTYDSIAVNPSWLYRGYTGHEMLDSFQLINMNGRLYDPVIARMFSPDPFVQAPNSLQNYNRYSYVMNNPLSYTDPSGYQYSSGGRMESSYSTNFFAYMESPWDPTMGFTSSFGMVSSQYGSMAALMGYSSGELNQMHTKGFVQRMSIRDEINKKIEANKDQFKTVGDMINYAFSNTPQSGIGLFNFNNSFLVDELTIDLNLFEEQGPEIAASAGPQKHLFHVFGGTAVFIGLDKDQLSKFAIIPESHNKNDPGIAKIIQENGVYQGIDGFYYEMYPNEFYKTSATAKVFIISFGGKIDFYKMDGIGAIFNDYFNGWSKKRHEVKNPFLN